MTKGRYIWIYEDEMQVIQYIPNNEIETKEELALNRVIERYWAAESVICHPEDLRREVVDAEGRHVTVSIAPSSPRPEQGCSCPWPGAPSYVRPPGAIDPNCPVHGRPERCPTCKSAFPTERNTIWLKGTKPQRSGPCPDLWHSR